MAISKKFFVDIDLQGNGLNNSTVGANANMTKAGSFQYNAAETRLEYFNGSLVEQVANLSDIAAVTGGLILQGGYDAATNTPDIADGNALKGYFWVVTVAGTFLGETVQVGDSIIAKVDEAGALLTDWLILQGNVVIATTEVAGITYLATQEQVNGGTETGAYAVTPATLQGKLDPINTDITNLENDKLARDGSQAMTGHLDMGNRNISNVAQIYTGIVSTNLINSSEGEVVLGNTFNADSNAITNLPAPTNGGDATNKTYVDGQVATALPLAGGTMSGVIDMNGNAFKNAVIENGFLDNALNAGGSAIINLPAPTNGGDATNKTYVDSVGATAESNANTYTDTQIAAQSYTATIATGDWTLNAGVYEYTITHNLGSYVTFTAFYDGATADFNGSYAANTLTVYSNSLPSANTVVNVVKAGGNI
jgi:hypothetical protein